MQHTNDTDTETEAYMLRFFYFTRNIAGLILVISPLAGFLYIDFNFTLSMIFLCSMAAGIPLGSACYNYLNFKLWTSLACIAACLGAFLLHTDLPVTGIGVSAAFGMAFLGLYAGGLAAVVPANLLVSWFHASKTILTGTVFSVSFLLGIPLAALMERYTYPVLLLSIAMMLTGILFFLQQPPIFLCAPVLCEDIRFKAGRKTMVIRLFVFIMTVSFAGGLPIFNPETPYSLDYFISPKVLFILGLAAGPFIAGLLSEFKGVYSGCIFIIFLAELSIFSFGEGQTALQLYINAFSRGMLLSSMTVVIPITIYYTYGPGGYNSCLGKVYAAFPLGLALAGAISGYASVFAGTHIIPSQTVSVFLLLLLIACFFTIFSTWKHRFILLK